MNATITGGCACGAVRYEITAPPLMAGHCQCRDCQRMTGAGHASMMGVPEAAYRQTGTLRHFNAKADSGAMVARGFCPECGSFVIGRSTGMPGMVTVAAASLDEPAQFRPQLVVYTASAQPWDHVDPALPHFERMPPMSR